MQFFCILSFCAAVLHRFVSPVRELGGFPRRCSAGCWSSRIMRVLRAAGGRRMPIFSSRGAVRPALRAARVRLIAGVRRRRPLSWRERSRRFGAKSVVFGPQPADAAAGTARAAADCCGSRSVETRTDRRIADRDTKSDHSVSLFFLFCPPPSPDPSSSMIALLCRRLDGTVRKMRIRNFSLSD